MFGSLRKRRKGPTFWFLVALAAIVVIGGIITVLVAVFTPKGLTSNDPNELPARSLQQVQRSVTAAPYWIR